MPELTSNKPPRGPIVVSRHGRPQLDRSAGPRLDWRTYRDWWERYEMSPLREDQVAPEVLKAEVANADIVFASARIRAQQTAERAAPHLPAEDDAVFNEAALPPPLLQPVTAGSFTDCRSIPPLISPDGLETSMGVVWPQTVRATPRQSS